MAAAALFLAGGNPPDGLAPIPDNQTPVTHVELNNLVALVFASIAGDPFKRALALTAEAMLGSRLGDNTTQLAMMVQALSPLSLFQRA